jgi:hypothetical protein
MRVKPQFLPTLPALAVFGAGVRTGRDARARYAGAFLKRAQAVRSPVTVATGFRTP